MSRNNNTALAGVPDTGPLATLQLWGTHKPTADDWLEYLILLHPVMKDTVDAALARMEKIEATVPLESSPPDASKPDTTGDSPPPPGPR